MIEGMNEEARIESIQGLMTRIEYTENTIEPLCVGDGQVQVDSNAVANMLLHSVLNQLTIMNTLKAILLKDGEKVVPMPEPENPEQN